MPVTTINPTAFANPDQGGTTAFSSAGNTGGSSSADASFSDSSGSDAEADSCRWHGFTYSGPAPTALKLKLTWDGDGSANMSFSVGGTGSAFAGFVIEYSTNGGSNWTTQVDESASLSGAGSDSFDTDGNESVVLNPTTTISQIQVRARLDASVDISSGTSSNSADATVNVVITNIRLEITTPDGGIIVMM